MEASRSLLNPDISLIHRGIPKLQALKNPAQWRGLECVQKGQTIYNSVLMVLGNLINSNNRQHPSHLQHFHRERNYHLFLRRYLQLLYDNCLLQHIS